jgi:hypothetical protein
LEQIFYRMGGPEFEGGVNASLNLDSHGKSWSYLLLALEVEID